MEYLAYLPTHFTKTLLKPELTIEEQRKTKLKNEFFDKLQIRKKKLFINGQVVEFSKSQYDCFKYIKMGYSNKQIAKVMGKSPRTIDDHITRIQEKLEIFSKREILKLEMNE